MINMLRQVGLAVGVSVFVAVVGSPTTPEASLHAFEHGWTVIALDRHSWRRWLGRSSCGTARPREADRRRSAGRRSLYSRPIRQFTRAYPPRVTGTAQLGAWVGF